MFILFVFGWFDSLIPTSSWITFSFNEVSMTTIADLNDKWASYAGPGGWNGDVIQCLIHL